MGSKLSGSLHIRTREQLSWVHTLRISDCREQDGPVVPTAAVRSIIEFMLSLPIGCLQPMMSRETRDSTWAWGLPGSLFEIKRRLLLGRKVMTNLDSILKSRDITLPRKVRLVKAMVFPVVMYRCEIWTCEENWAPNNWCFWTVVLEKALESPLDCKEIQPVHSEGDQP